MIVHGRKAHVLEGPESSLTNPCELELLVAIDRDWPSVSMIGMTAEIGIVFESLEVRQYVVKAPTFVSILLPNVVVGWRTANCESRYPRGAAQELAPPNILGETAFPAFRYVAPVEVPSNVPAIAVLLGNARSEVRPRLKKQDRAGTGLGET
jgi:hypothetical protein